MDGPIVIRADGSMDLVEVVRLRELIDPVGTRMRLGEGWDAEGVHRDDPVDGESGRRGSA